MKHHLWGKIKLLAIYYLVSITYSALGLHDQLPRSFDLA